DVDRAVLHALEKKGILEVFEREVSRLGQAGQSESVTLPELSADQKRAIDEIRTHFEVSLPVLLHGITGSGKTLVYAHLIKECLDAGKQVLYLVPEIALTTQTVKKVQQYFNEKILVYHSRM